jgi:hypothetical protein
MRYKFLTWKEESRFFSLLMYWKKRIQSDIIIMNQTSLRVHGPKGILRFMNLSQAHRVWLETVVPPDWKGEGTG